MMFFRGHNIVYHQAEEKQGQPVEACIVHTAVKPEKRLPLKRHCLHAKQCQQGGSPKPKTGGTF